MAGGAGGRVVWSRRATVLRGRGDGSEPLRSRGALRARAERRGRPDGGRLGFTLRRGNRLLLGAFEARRAACVSSGSRRRAGHLALGPSVRSGHEELPLGARRRRGRGGRRATFGVAAGSERFWRRPGPSSAGLRERKLLWGSELEREKPSKSGGRAWSRRFAGGRKPPRDRERGRYGSGVLHGDAGPGRARLPAPDFRSRGTARRQMEPVGSRGPRAWSGYPAWA